MQSWTRFVLPAALAVAGCGMENPNGGAGGAGGAGGNGGITSVGGAGGTSSPGVSVLQHHNHASRDGVYVDAALSKVAISSLHLDPSFASASLAGPTYAQPLYLGGSNGQRDLVIAATEQNHAYAFDAATGAVVWDQVLGTPLPRSQLDSLRAGCGNIDPLGVTGAPIIDPATRTIYLDAMTMANGGTAHHLVFALDADTGAPLAGWPVDLNATARFGATSFDSLVQNQRGALALLGGRVFVPFGGHIGDCADYHGWVVGISTTNPADVAAWATRAIAGGVWAPSGIASDGSSLYFATGNTENTANNFSPPASWQDGETIFKLPPSLVFSGATADYFVPTNWQALDASDADIGGTGPIVLDLGGTKLVLGLGKDGKAYLLDRNNLGGISAPLAGGTVSTGAIINAAAAYTTPAGTYVVFKGSGSGCPSGQTGGLTAIKLAPGSPPTISVAWCGGPSTQDSPMVSMTDPSGANAVVWIVGSDNRLHGLDGDTGQSVFGGGSAADGMSSVQRYQTPIVARGRIFVAANSQLYAFTP